MTDFIIVLCTINNNTIAKKIARLLLDKKLAACINILPKINSIYTWENKICEETEYLMLIKTHKKLFNKIKEEIVLIHPYSIPEIISIDISNGNQKYLDWLQSSYK